MAFLKHIGRHAKTGQRLVIVFMQLPEDENHALVIYSDALPDRYHQAVMEALESPEGQSSKQLYEVLTRKVFWHGQPMLDTVHREGLLVKVKTEDVIMTPNTNTNIPLNELNQQIKESQGDTPVEKETVEDTRSQTDVNVSESQQDEARQIAQNLLIQAELLERDAEAKRQEAYKYDPSLNPENKPKAKRGRPKKSEAKNPESV